MMLMFEETNQTPTAEVTETDGSDMFDGLLDTDESTQTENADVQTGEAENGAQAESETNTENSENAENGENTGENSESALPDIQMPVTYLGQTVTLNSEELKTNAQKGLNYDFVKAERDKYAPVYQAVEKYAKLYGQTPEEYIGYVSNDFKRVAAEKYAADNGTDLGTAEKMIEMQAKLDTYEQPPAQKSTEEMLRECVEKFSQENPGSTLNGIPLSVFSDFVESGGKFDNAYAKYENAALKKQIADMQQNKKNTQTAVGSVSSDAKGTESDAFLDGFNGI